VGYTWTEAKGKTTWEKTDRGKKKRGGRGQGKKRKKRRPRRVRWVRGRERQRGIGP